MKILNAGIARLVINNIVKTCKIHGELTQEDVSINKRNYTSKTTGIKRLFIQLLCNKCRDIYYKKYSSTNRDKLYARQREWVKNNPDNCKITRKRSYIKNRQKRIDLSIRLNKTPTAKARKKEYVKKERSELKGSYIKKILIGKRNISSSSITKELIDTKRALLSIKRIIKDEKNATQNTD